MFSKSVTQEQTPNYPALWLPVSCSEFNSLQVVESIHHHIDLFIRVALDTPHPLYLCISVSLYLCFCVSMYLCLC